MAIGGGESAGKLGWEEFGPQFKALAIQGTILVVCFAVPLYRLARFALGSALFSYIILVPFISAYLFFLRKGELQRGTPPNKIAALIVAFFGLAVLGGYWLTEVGRKASDDSYFVWNILSFVLLLVASCFFCLERETMRKLAFPISFLGLLIPWPTAVTARIETFLQHTSAFAAQVLFGLTGLPVLREGLQFQLPGIRLEVAPECSGIHSTLVLLITSLVAGELFLRTPWKRAALCLVVIPLGILRNAVRICTIGQLCVHVGPHMIDSPIHHRGGPIFFVASLVPFFAFLWLLRRSESETTFVPESKPRI